MMPIRPLVPRRAPGATTAALAALALSLAGPALAEDAGATAVEAPAMASPLATPDSDPVVPRPGQLDRIGAKLDAILRRLGSEEIAPETGAFPSEEGGGGGAAAAASPASDAEPAGTSFTPTPESYLPGAVALARAAPREARRLGEVPPDSVGGFVYAGGPIGLGDLSDRGVRYTGLAGVELQGWLRSTGTGRAQLAADLRVSFGKGALAEVPCLFEAWLEDQAIGAASQAVRPWDNRQGPTALSLVLGAELQPGLYKFRAWIVCAAGSSAPPRVEAELLLKAPGALNLGPVSGDDLVHKPG